MQAIKGLAQNKTVFDVFSNREYTYNNKYKEIKDAELNLNREIEINYFAMRNEGAEDYNTLNTTAGTPFTIDYKNELWAYAPMSQLMIKYNSMNNVLDSVIKERNVIRNINNINININIKLKRRHSF
jgi:hypothetical protein